MSNKPIPTTDHISRYCKPSMVDGEKPQPSAFHLREKETSLSVDWLEFLKKVTGSCDSAAISKALSNRNFAPKPRGRHAVFNVGDLVDYVKKNAPDERVLSVSHEPRHKTDSHSGVANFTYEENNLFSVLISQAIKKVLKP